MLLKELTIAATLLAALAYGGAVSAQSPTPASPTATPTTISEKTPIPATATSKPATPLPESDTAVTLVGYVIEDTDGNGSRSPEDRPAETLVTLSLTAEGRIYGEGTKGAQLLTDDTGRFEFDDLVPGDYELIVWWMPGFVGAQGTLVPEELSTDTGYTPEGRPTTRFAHLLRFKVAVAADGTETLNYSTRESTRGSVRNQGCRQCTANPVR